MFNTSSPTTARNFKLLIALQAFSLGLVLFLALWWGTLIRNYSDQVRELELKLGSDITTVTDKHQRVQNMLMGESATFLFLLIASNSFLIFYTFRDYRRQKSLQAFFASVTHELRTPLTGIRLQAEAIADQTPANSPISNWTGRLMQDVSRLEGQVQRTLELARIEGGGKLMLQPVSLNKQFEKWKETSNLFNPEQIVVDIQGEAISVNADPAALSVIFRNIVENAQKYSTSNPTQLKVQFSNNSMNCIHLNPDLSSPPDHYGRLFSRGSKSQGAGVGLYLIAALMKNMNGSVQFLAQNSFETKMTFQKADQS